MKSNQSRWYLVVGMMLATFLFGTDLFSSENTRPIIRWIVTLFFGEQAGSKVSGGGEGLLRKSAHFLEYALLAWCWWRALQGDQYGQWKGSWFLVAFAATVLWACVDELQQAFGSTQRTGSPWDVLIDSSGALTALALASLITWWRRK
jgi:hypothetical protein